MEHRTLITLLPLICIFSKHCLLTSHRKLRRSWHRSTGCELGLLLVSLSLPKCLATLSKVRDLTASIHKCTALDILCKLVYPAPAVRPMSTRCVHVLDNADCGAMFKRILMNLPSSRIVSGSISTSVTKRSGITAHNTCPKPPRSRGLKYSPCNAGYPGGYPPQQGYPQQGYQQQYPQQQNYPPQVLYKVMTHAPELCNSQVWHTG